MTHQELNRHILHYITEDKTKSAIMLTGGWGTGKSYYIQNTLLPFLSEEENGKRECIVISLYGMQNTFEISKAIYLECRAKKLTGESEKEVAGRMAARTVIKGVTSFFGVDISKTEAEMLELYNSIDLSNKLIILEDIERSQIDIIEVLGYVNNLVEQDNVKVLLVINEKPLIKTKQIETKGPGTYNFTKTVFTEKTQHYLGVKEKTVGDTIYFTDDFPTAVSQIVQSFNNETLTSILTRNGISEIVSVLRKNSCNNLRSFIFCCQKTVDIFERMESSLLQNAEFCKVIFYGNLYFIAKRRAGTRENWSNEALLSVSLGSSTAPLFRFCYDYIIYQDLNSSEIEKAYKAWEDFKQFGKADAYNDDDIKALSNYYVHTEEEVAQALNRITDRMRTDKNDIPFRVYGEIAVDCILIKYNLGIGISEIAVLLVNNLRGLNGHIQTESVFRTDWTDKSNEKASAEYYELKQAMIASLKDIQSIIPGFDYKPEQSGLLYISAKENIEVYKDLDCFASCLDMNRLTSMYFHCSAKGKDDIRQAFSSVYDLESYIIHFKADADSINLLSVLLREQKPEKWDDRIQKLQYTWFIDLLNKIHKRLSSRT